MKTKKMKTRKNKKCGGSAQQGRLPHKPSVSKSKSTSHTRKSIPGKTAELAIQDQRHEAEMQARLEAEMQAHHAEMQARLQAEMQAQLEAEMQASNTGTADVKPLPDLPSLMSIQNLESAHAYRNIVIKRFIIANENLKKIENKLRHAQSESKHAALLPKYHEAQRVVAEATKIFEEAPEATIQHYEAYILEQEANHRRTEQLLERIRTSAGRKKVHKPFTFE